MSELQIKLPTDTWVDCTWDKFIEAIEEQRLAKAKSYYHNAQLRIEMSPVGPDHADDNGIIVVLVNLFGIATGIPMRLLVNCSYRKPGVREAQPDDLTILGNELS